MGLSSVESPCCTLKNDTAAARKLTSSRRLSKSTNRSGSSYLSNRARCSLSVSNHLVILICMGFGAGTVVAVKVRHPGVGEAIQRDFALMMRVARLTSALPFLAHLRLEDTLAQFAAPLREQVHTASCPSHCPLFRPKW